MSIDRAMAGLQSDLSLLESKMERAFRRNTTSNLFKLAAQGKAGKVAKVLEEGLWKVDATNGDGETALHLASGAGQVEVVRVLLKRGALLDLKTRKNGLTALHLAALHDHAACVEVLLLGRASTLVKSGAGATALHVACAGGYRECMAMILSGGSALRDMADGEGRTALHLCCERGDGVGTRALLKLGAATELRTHDKGLTPLHCAVVKGDVDCVRVLLTLGGAATDAVDGEGWTPLHRAASQADRVAAELTTDLIRAGAGCEATNGTGSTPLHAAAFHGNAGAVAALLGPGGARPNAVNATGWTPLHLAAHAGSCACLRALAAHGGDLAALDRAGRTPAGVAAAYGHRGCVQTLEGLMPVPGRPATQAAAPSAPPAAPPPPPPVAPPPSAAPTTIPAQPPRRAEPSASLPPPPHALESAALFSMDSDMGSMSQGPSGPPTPQVGKGGPERLSSTSSGASGGSGTSGMSGVSGRFSAKQQLIMGALSVWSIKLSDIEMGKELGKGAFGKIFAGRWNEAPVAVKRLDDLDNIMRSETEEVRAGVVEALHAEAGLLAAMRHPNIVTFMGISTSPPAIITELCARGSLFDVLKTARGDPASLPWSRRLRMAIEAAQGLHYLHSSSPPIIHRDLKSLNLLVDADFHIKVCDFGLSRMMLDAATTLQSSGTLNNVNPRWLAPEVLGGGKASPASDIFAFGIVMWELMTLEIPWARELPWRIMAMVTMQGASLDVPPAAELPGGGFAGLAAYTALMRRCWAHDPAQRPASLARVLADLRTIQL